MGGQHGPWCGGHTYPTECRDCMSPIFVFRCLHGSVVVFEKLGWPWPQHECAHEQNVDVGSAVLPQPTRWRRIGSKDWNVFAAGVEARLVDLAFDVALIIDTGASGVGCLAGYTSKGIVVAITTRDAKDHEIDLARLGFGVLATLPAAGSWRTKRFDFLEQPEAAGAVRQIFEHVLTIDHPSNLRAGEQIWW